MISKEDKILIKNLWESKGYGAWQLIREFPNKNWKRSSIENLLRKLRETGSLDRRLGSSRPRTSRSSDNVSAVEELAHRACDTIELLLCNTPDFIEPDVWPPNSPDLNPVDYAIWSVIQQRVYETRVHDIDELRQRPLRVWHGLEQSLIDVAVDLWQTRLRACVHANGGHFEHIS